MKFLLTAAFAILSSVAFTQPTIINDKNAEHRTVMPFSGINASGGIQVYLSQSDDYSLAVSAGDENDIADIKTEVKDGILFLNYNGSKFHWKRRSSRPRAYISFKALERIEASGACDFNIMGNIDENSLLIRLSGASVIKGTLNTPKLILEFSGASTAAINGTAQNLNITLEGASDVRSYDLKTENCVARLSGASDVRITVTGSIVAKASGASTLYYQGTPDKKDISTSGASTVSADN